MAAPLKSSPSSKSAAILSISSSLGAGRLPVPVGGSSFLTFHFSLVLVGSHDHELQVLALMRRHLLGVLNETAPFAGRVRSARSGHVGRCGHVKPLISHTRARAYEGDLTFLPTSAHIRLRLSRCRWDLLRGTISIGTLPPTMTTICSVGCRRVTAAAGKKSLCCMCAIA